VGRPVLRPAALFTLCSALLLGGLASGLLAATGRAGAAATGTTATGATTTAKTTTSSARSVLVVTGHGWGHGLGLSQWGADGYARHGWTYDRILAHYYTGTTLGKASVSTVRVQIVDGRRTVLSSDVPWTVTDATGAKTPLQPGAVELTPALTVQGAKLQGPLVFASAKPLLVDGHGYRGKLEASLDGKRLQIVDVVGLEAYVKGVVPAEMPSSWPAEALKAQAVAARSYALANLQQGESFDLYGDGRNQIYGGVGAETPAASAAVDATRGIVVLYGGKVADTVFCASSGGRTATAAEATGRAVPYLVSVADPYDVDSPYHDWGPVLVDVTRLGKLLKLPGDLSDLQATLGSDGRVRRLTALSAGGQVAITGAQARDDLDLRSTWFTAALLSLRPPGKIAYGGAATLAGSVSGVAGVTLESRVGSGPWQQAGAVAPAADGSFSLVVRPQATTSYRLAWANVRAALVRVAVTPLVSAGADANGVTGTIRPASAATVQLQQQTPGSKAWATVAAGSADASGAFSFPGALAAGAYRVRAAPGHGLSPGLSPTLQVP
jgi:stage II sporulation protein D